MTHQATINFDAPHNSTPTSIEAAVAIKPSADSLRTKVLEFIQRHPDGLTREEIELGTGIQGNTVRPRVQELIVLKRVIETADKRKTRSGRNAAVVKAI